MSCQLSVIAQVNDITGVRRFLFPTSKKSVEATDEQNIDNEGWDADWEWSAEDNNVQDIVEKKPEEDDENKNQWVQDCFMSLSPTNDLLAMAYLDKLVILAQKYDPNNSGNGIDSMFSTVWQGSITNDEREVITDVMCLPLASQKRSTQGAPDWTCLIVGFSSGYVKFYTETGTLLLSQLLHNEPVQRLKCRTYQPPRYLGEAEQHEELVILFRSVLVTIDGFSLFQSLRACRNQVARATASGNDNNSLLPPPLAYKKWTLQEQNKIFDHVSCGIHTPNPYDQMKTASVLGGFGATIKPTPPAATIYLTAGMGPYVGFFYAMEGSTQPILSEVAYAVASKLKSAFMSAASGWLGIGTKQKEENREKQKIEPATPLPLRFGIPDKRREGGFIVISPNNNFAAVADSFGRVILVDVNKGIAIRMWKGYRDAEVGWIQVKEDTHPSEQSRDGKTRIAQFLVIYAPRRGILEIWTAANGPRVAAFNVNKGCQLVCPGYGMLGLNNVTSKGVKTRGYQCALIDPDGYIKTIDVPFHLALSDKNSKRARDLHLLRKLKLLLKESSEETGELETSLKDILNDMKMSGIVRQGVERVLGTKSLSVTFMKNIIKSCVTRLCQKGQDVDIDSKLLLQYCHVQESLLHTYELLDKLNSSTNDMLSEDRLHQDLVELLCLPAAEVTHILTQYDRFSPDEKAVHVRFKETKLPISTFLHCFSFHLNVSDSESDKGNTISLAKHLSEEKKHGLAKLLYHRCLSGHASPSELGVILQESNIPPDVLMSLLLLHWLSEDNCGPMSIQYIYHVVKNITAITDKSEVLVEHSAISPWWQRVRDQCCQSENIRPAYIASVACRGVAMDTVMSQTKAKLEKWLSRKCKDPDADTSSCHSENTDMSEWESLYVDIEQWNLVIKQLEDILTVHSFLSLRLPTENNYALSGASGSESVRVCVNKILDGGKGSVSEIIAKYIAQEHLRPEDLFSKHFITNEDDSPTESAEEAMETEISNDKSRIYGHIDELKHRFPHSLDNDVLFSNCCWECMVLWKKEPEVISNFELSLQYLKLVQNAVLRQGVSSMLWHMFLVKKFSSAASLIDKVGKAPKDRLCRKEVGVSEACMSKFLEQITELLIIAMDANCEANEVPVFNIEPLWQQTKGPASLVELAIDQKTTNYGLVRHHYHLALHMYAIVKFMMKSIKLFSLFDRKGKAAFFQDFHSHPLLPNQNIDQDISILRREFLSRVISNAVQTLENHIENVTSSTCESLSTKHKNHPSNKWPALAVELGKEFGLDIDYLKRHHVCELYSGGHDKLADEVLLTVNDREVMGSQLLLLAGQRISHHLVKLDAAESVKLMSNTPTNVSTWLKSLDPSHLRQPDVSKNEITALVGHVANYLPEGYAEYNLAISLVELTESLT